jgi:hypothetical protein
MDRFENLTNMVCEGGPEGKLKLQSVCHSYPASSLLRGVQVELTSLVTFLKLLQTASVEKSGQAQDSPGHLKLGSGGS